MTSRGRSRYGLLVSALGATILAVSVYLPWYGVHVAQAGPGAGGHAGQLSGEQALSGLAVVLLVLTGLSLLDALSGIARAASVAPDGAGGAVVLLGLVAGACVLYRMVAPPSGVGAVALTLREGAWTALLGSLMISLGGLWPRTLPGIAPAETIGADVWSALTGWTPNA
jgi:hypothetical protein